MPSLAFPLAKEIVSVARSVHCGFPRASQFGCRKMEAVATAILAWPVYVIRPTKKELAIKPHLRVGLGNVRHLLLLQIAEGNARVPQERVGSSTSHITLRKKLILFFVESDFC